MKNLLWTVIPMCIVGIVLGVITNKRQQEDRRMTEESLASIDNFVDDAMKKEKAE